VGPAGVFRVRSCRISFSSRPVRIFDCIR
jgi:hypothetical protein